VSVLTGFVWFTTRGRVVGLCKNGNISSVFIEGGQFLDWLSDHQIHKMDYALWNYLRCVLFMQGFAKQGCNFEADEAIYKLTAINNLLFVP
jgi:hypothetical protein